MAPVHNIDIAAARAAFPALAVPKPFIFADNAGGSQCLTTVIQAVSDYLVHSNVQLGAGYSVSVAATKRIAEAKEAARELFNAASVDEIAFGSSSTQVSENLARALEEDFSEGDEIIITPEHEANSGSWKRLAARRRCIIKTWRPRLLDAEQPYSLAIYIVDLLPLITARTRLVAITSCSNILGSLVSVADITKQIREQATKLGAKKIEVVVDCVAYASHRQIDVRAWDVDYAFFSYYKVYGVHVAALYARSVSLKNSVSSLAHHFLPLSAPGSTNAFKITAPSGPCYELAVSGIAIVAYLKGLTPEGTLSAAFDAITIQENVLVNALLEFLTAPRQFSRGVRVIGDPSPSPSRIPTISFIVRGDRPLSSREIVAHLDNAGGVGIRFGNFYAYTLVKELMGIEDVNDGVVRISLVHYNTLEEVTRIVGLLAEVFA